MDPKRQFDAQGQPLIEETGPKVRALALRNWSNPQEMLGNVGVIFSKLSEFGLKFLGTGSTHHGGSETNNTDTVILFECDDRTYAQLRRQPSVASARELNPHTVMRILDADVRNAKQDEIKELRSAYRAKVVERLLLEGTPSQFRRLTRFLTKFDVDITGVRKPGKVQRNEVADYKMYVQNIHDEARAAIEVLMSERRIEGGWGDKTTVRLNGNVVDVQRLEEHLHTQFFGRIDRLDLGPVSAIIREEKRPTARVRETDRP